MNHKERDFRDSLREIAPLYNCELIEIPDVVPIKRDGFIPVSKKRPCDDLLITSHGNYWIEAKYQYNALLPHQEVTQSKVNSINNTYYVIRKKVTKKGVFYQVEQNGETLFKTTNITKIFAFFKDPSEHNSQTLMTDSFFKHKTVNPKIHRKVLG